MSGNSRPISDEKQKLTQKKCLTRKQSKFVKTFAEGTLRAEAIKAAGYSTNVLEESTECIR